MPDAADAGKQCIVHVSEFGCFSGRDWIERR
jgi:hypothetical protein